MEEGLTFHGFAPRHCDCNLTTLQQMELFSSKREPFLLGQCVNGQREGNWDCVLGDCATMTLCLICALTTFALLLSCNSFVASTLKMCATSSITKLFPTIYAQFTTAIHCSMTFAVTCVPIGQMRPDSR